MVFSFDTLSFPFQEKNWYPNLPWLLATNLNPKEEFSPSFLKVRKGLLYLLGLYNCDYWKTYLDSWYIDSELIGYMNVIRHIVFSWCCFMFAVLCLVAQFEAKRLLKNANEVEKKSYYPSCLIFVWKSVLKLFCHIFCRVHINPILFISLLFKGLSRVFSNTRVQKHQFFSVQLSLWSNIHTWPLEKT